jgi:hypothetical protein
MLTENVYHIGFPQQLQSPHMSSCNRRIQFATKFYETNLSRTADHEVHNSLIYEVLRCFRTFCVYGTKLSPNTDHITHATRPVAPERELPQFIPLPTHPALPHYHNNDPAIQKQINEHETKSQRKTQNTPDTKPKPKKKTQNTPT